MLIFIVTFNIFPAIVFWSTLQDKTADFECNAECMERRKAEITDDNKYISSVVSSESHYDKYKYPHLLLLGLLLVVIDTQEESLDSKFQKQI